MTSEINRFEKLEFRLLVVNGLSFVRHFYVFQIIWRIDVHVVAATEGTIAIP